MKKMFNMPQITGGGGERTLGFTLAEVLITLAIIGVVAALTIPSVIANTQQQEFKTGLKKAVSVLNSAITMNMALEGESPYDNSNLYAYLGRHMSVMKTNVLSYATGAYSASNWAAKNVSFYTTDGMRFEFPNENYIKQKLHYNGEEITLRGTIGAISYNNDTVKSIKDCDGKLYRCSQCGSYGLESNEDNTQNQPCLIVVDVNGDRKPFPQNANCHKDKCGNDQPRYYGDPNGKRLPDTFAIMITDKQAVPYGVVAQKAMYNTQK